MLGGESRRCRVASAGQWQGRRASSCWKMISTAAPTGLVDARWPPRKCVVVIDHQMTATTESAHLVLPAASFAEGDGTVVSKEGRAQRFFQVYDPEYYDPSILIQEGWRWLHALHTAMQNQRASTGRSSMKSPRPCAAAHSGAGPHRRSRAERQLPRQGPERLPAHRAATPVAPRCAPISPCTNRAPRRMTTAHWRSPWKVTSGPNEDASRCSICLGAGLELAAGLEQIPGRSRRSHLRAGDAGVRLIEASTGDSAELLRRCPAPRSTAAPGTWQVVPLHHLFGSEETVGPRRGQERASGSLTSR